VGELGWKGNPFGQGVMEVQKLWFWRLILVCRSLGTREKITPSQKKKLGLFNTHPNQRENLSSVGTILRGVVVHAFGPGTIMPQGSGSLVLVSRQTHNEEMCVNPRKL